MFTLSDHRGTSWFEAPKSWFVETSRSWRCGRQLYRPLWQELPQRPRGQVKGMSMRHFHVSFPWAMHQKKMLVFTLPNRNNTNIAVLAMWAPIISVSVAGTATETERPGSRRPRRLDRDVCVVSVWQSKYQHFFLN